MSFSKKDKQQALITDLESKLLSLSSWISSRSR